jgi:broad specificity phosphatase PhoE
LFPADEPLDERGRAAAAAAVLPARRTVLSSPARCCLETAEAAGLDAPALEPALRECDYGDWRGRPLADVDIALWRTDPQARPHGGESLAAFSGRVAAWLDAQGELDGPALAITHAGVVRAAVVHALRAPWEAFWQIDVAPLSVTELHGRGDGWTVAQVNA